MKKVVGVRFRTASKIYFFDPLDLDIKKGAHVIVETARGIEYGTVVAAPKDVEDEEVVQPLKPVLRIASERDDEQAIENKKKEREAFRVCQEKIREHELEMKLIDAEYTFDNNKVLFYFTADGRVDFRDLVKDLAAVFKTRIELRQIGVRDETKIIGGIGICGRPLCCHSYLADFVPVSIKMAKEQNLSLNPTKISGVCGRLMCCLKNEEDTYEELNRKLPGLGDCVTTADGEQGEVASVNVLRQTVRVLIEKDDEKEMKEFPADQLVFTKRKHNKKKVEKLDEEDLKALELLEAEDRITADENGGKSRRRDYAGENQNRGRGNGEPEGGENHGRENRRFDKNHDRKGGQGNRFEQKPFLENGEDTSNEMRQEERENPRFENRGNGQNNHFENRAEGQNNRFENRAEGQNKNRDNRKGGKYQEDRRNHKENRNQDAAVDANVREGGAVEQTEPESGKENGREGGNRGYRKNRYNRRKNFNNGNSNTEGKREN